MVLIHTNAPFSERGAIAMIMTFLELGKLTLLPGSASVMSENSNVSHETERLGTRPQYKYTYIYVGQGLA